MAKTDIYAALAAATEAAGRTLREVIADLSAMELPPPKAARRLTWATWRKAKERLNGRQLWRRRRSRGRGTKGGARK